MRVLFIGGTGEISLSCVRAAQTAGHEVTILNRGFSAGDETRDVEKVVGDLTDTNPYQAIEGREFDVVCQFLAFRPETCARDAEFFAGRCGQYIFISTASAYQKPGAPIPMTEDTPLENPYWAYSRAKADCEKLLLNKHAEAVIPVTIVRPSHTYRARLPSTVISGDHLAWRVLNGKKIIVHGDGESIWTLTHADDFARGFVGLFGKEEALGECFHITEEEGHSWNNIFKTVGNAIGHESSICPVPVKDLIAYEPSWRGPLLGDKANMMLFDNQKISSVSGGWGCDLSLANGVKRTWAIASRRLSGGFKPDPELDALVDRIIADHD